MASSENVPATAKATGKSDTGYTGKNGGIGGEDSSSYDPMKVGGNTGLPKSVSSPL